VDERLYGYFFEVEERFWWNVATRRAFFRTLAPVAPPPAARVVDVGCGTGIVLREFPWPVRSLVGCDAAPVALALTRRREIRDLVRADVGALPFADAALDLVLALDVIEHLDDDGAALAELARVVRPGGYLLLHVPAFNMLWSDKDDINHHRRRYRRPAARRLLRAAGLDVVSLTYLNAVLLPPALLRSAWQRLRPPDPVHTDAFLQRLYHPRGATNAAMIALLGLEGRLARWLPFGTSLLALARRPP
jgi:SAM-dependent methyltransferase